MEQEWMGMFQNSKITLVILNFYAVTFLVEKRWKNGKHNFCCCYSLPYVLHTLVPMHIYVLFCWLALLLCRYYKVTNGTLLHCFPRKANMYPTKLCILIRLTLNWGLSSMYKLYSQPLHNTMYSPSKHFQRKNILHTPLSALYSWSNIEYFFHFDINFWHFWSSWSISNLYWLQWSEDDRFF